MKKSFALLCFILVGISMVWSQKSIQSNVFDAKNGLALEMATVRLLQLKDSALVQGVQTDTKGGFLLPKVKKGDYILIVSSVGYNDISKNVKMDGKDIILSNIQMKENVLALKELDVKGTAAQMVVKGDTLEYNATAFKTQENAVVEDLLKRLPGVEISTDGKITVNGEEVKKIRIDGKKFFDGDAEMATKNIPAEMIDKIQVLEQKSDMALLTGFEDGDTERIINLTTKSNRRKGLFGNVNGGLGMDIEENLRYDANANLNIMEGDTQTSIVGGANNINNSRSGRGRRGWGGMNSGITTTENLGVNNNSIINPKFKIGGDASFNHTRNFVESESNKESYLKESVYNDSTYNRSNNDGLEANLRLETEWKIDSTKTLVLQPNINYNQNISDSFRDYRYLTDGDTTTTGFSNNNGRSESRSGGLRLIYNQKLSKPGRTLTVNVSTGFSNSDSKDFNYSRKYAADTTKIDQFTRNTSDRFNVDFRASFVEPLWNLKHMLETSVSFNSTTQNSNKMQYRTDDVDAYYRQDESAYDTYVEAYSNNFSNQFYRERLELNYRYTEPTYNVMFGVMGEPTQTYSHTIYGDGAIRNVSNEVINFAPTSRIQYNFGKKEFLRFDYRGSTQQPSVSQMQPVKNNSNLMNETVGNPSLNPAFNSNFRLMYSTFNDKTFSSFSTMMGANVTKDALVSNSIYDLTGKQYNQTVNATATPVNFNGNVMFNTPIIQKRLHFNTSTNGGYSLRYGYSSKGVESDLVNVDDLILGDLSRTRNYNVTEQMSLTFTHDVIELGAMGRLRYANTLNNLRDSETQTYDWTARGNIVARLPFNLTISSDINYSNRLGYSTFDQSELLWNASVDKTLFKNKGVLSVKWNDILKQQLNIRQNIGDNYIQFNRYNTLTSYFIVSFSYKINQFKGGSRETDFRQNRREFGPGDGPGRRMMQGSPGGMPGGGMPDMM